jgi:hypothetical protein
MDPNEILAAKLTEHRGSFHHGRQSDSLDTRSVSSAALSERAYTIIQDPGFRFAPPWAEVYYAFGVFPRCYRLSAHLCCRPWNQYRGPVAETVSCSSIRATRPRAVSRIPDASSFERF